MAARGGLMGEGPQLRGGSRLLPSLALPGPIPQCRGENLGPPCWEGRPQTRILNPTNWQLPALHWGAVTPGSCCGRTRKGTRCCTCSVPGGCGRSPGLQPRPCGTWGDSRCGSTWARFCCSLITGGVMEDKRTPLLVAAAAAAPEIVRDLLVLGANPDAADHRGRTALHLAAAYGHPQILQAMISSGVPVNVEARNFEGQTPLHCAVLAHNASLQGGHTPAGGSGGGSPTPQDRFRCVELLLQMGADSSSQDTKSSQTALHLAVRGGNLALAHLLLRQPGMAPRLVNMKAHGNTPLHMAAALRGTPSQEPLVRLLLAWGADPSARNLEHDLPQGLLPPGSPGDQLRLLLRSRRGSHRPPHTAE
ncbi:NF-kappa-B inhibitor delta-like isoform X3 [Prinia subflava]|uniref:NF-kappa-B inhibitor delta-like isoform X3 n=1 Tax=Prinia subflava TaxID=208062 RepID=UPI002FE084C6